MDQFLNKLVNMGYRRESVVSHIGELSLRGGTVDISSLAGEPIRVELSNTEVDSIRDFDVKTQRSRDNVEEVGTTTASGYIIIKEIIDHLKEELETAYENTRPRIDGSVRSNLKETYESFKLFESTYLDHQILRRLVAFIYGTPLTIIEYFQEDAIIAADEFNRIRETEESLTVESDSFIGNIIESGNGFIGQSFIRYGDFETLIEGYPVTYFSLSVTTTPIKLNHIIKFPCRPVQQSYGQYDIMHFEFQRYASQNYHIVALVETETEAECTQAILSGMHIPSITRSHRSMSPEQAVTIEGSLSEEFELPDMGLIIITEREPLKSKRKKQRERMKTTSNAGKIKSYRDLNVGGYIVHAHHGVGRYLGVKTLEVG